MVPIVLHVLVILHFQCSQQFLKDSVLRVDDAGDEEVAAAQRDLRRCSVHEVIDHTLNDPGQNREFKASLEEDDKVHLPRCCSSPLQC